ncbi:uncharacterized protein PHA67_001041 [Liasis olivaceus]
MSYQYKQPCPPPPTCGVQCSAEADDACTLAGVAPCDPTCDAGPSGPCDPPLLYQSRQPCKAPPCRPPPCPTAAPSPRALPCTSLYTDTCAEAPSTPCGSATWQPCTPFPADAPPCPLEEACTLPSPPTGGPGSPETCSDPQGDMGMPYVKPGSIVCLNPCGAVSVKPSSPEEEENSIFLASYTPHFT